MAKKDKKPKSAVQSFLISIGFGSPSQRAFDRMERAMFLEGMISRYDVLAPDRKRDWE